MKDNFLEIQADEKEDRLKNLATEITDEFKKRADERRGLESVWLLNLNFFLGNQYAEITPSGEIEDFGKQYFWQQREVYNHVAPLLETRLAKFTRISPSATVRPASNDEKDVNTAKFATKLLKSVQDAQNLQSLKNLANYYSELFGSAFYKVWWNPEKGRAVGIKDGAVLFEGEPEITVCPPYEIYPDALNARDIKECQTLIHAKAYPKEEAETRWGVKFTGGTVSVLNYSVGDVGGGFGYSAKNRRVVSDKQENAVLVLERYQKAHDGYPNGRLTIVAEDQVLFDGALPYRISEDGKEDFPFIRQVALENPESFFGSSVIERIIPVQRAYNAVKNRKHEFLNRISMGVMAVEDGSVDLDALETDGLSPGKILAYRQGARPPEMMGQPSVPSDFREEEASLLKEFLSVSGVSDLMTNSALVTNSNLSGVSLSLLIEQDDTRLALTASSIKNALRRVGQFVIRLFRQFAKEPRLARVCGEDGLLEMKSFQGSDLTSDDLVFLTENDISDTPANRKNMVVELLKLGLLSEDDGRITKAGKAKILEMMGFGNWESARDIEELHTKRAAEENESVRSGTIEINEADDHELHVAQHTRAIISKESKLSREAVARLNAHIREHKTFARLEAAAEPSANGQE